MAPSARIARSGGRSWLDVRFLIVAILGLVGKSLITTASKRKITVGDNLKADVEALKEGFRR